MPIAKIAIVTSSAEMSDAELYASYKRLAPASDLVFTRRNASDKLKARIDAIVKPNAKDAEAMRSARRLELWNEERASGEPAIGSERWHTALESVSDDTPEAA
jgi:hypothetical protein